MRSLFFAVCHRMETVIENESLQPQNCSKVKTLAGTSDICLFGEVKSSVYTVCLCLFVCFIGVPMRSFDSVSIDSELDSVCTEQIRQHLKGQAGERVQKTCLYGKEANEGSV